MMVISNTQISIGFDKSTGGIAEIADNTIAHEFIRNPSEKPTLWCLEFHDQAGKDFVLENTQVAPPTMHMESHSLSIEWSALDLPGEKGVVDVKVVCDLPGNADTASLRLWVRNRSKLFGLWTTGFPRISSLPDSKSAEVAISRSNWGQLYRNFSEPISGEYPSYTMPMQFMLVNEESAGLYLAAHDPGAMHKHFTYYPTGEFVVDTSTENMGVPGSGWSAPFAFALGVYQGDWMTGCKRYRAWVTKHAPWTRKGTLAERTDVPESMKKISAWIIGRGGPDTAVATGLDFAKAIGAPVGVHWYEWHQIPFDRQYPDYFPTKSGVADGVARMEAAGITVMPYINSRLWDTQEPRYSTALPHITKDEQGNPTLEDYGSGTKLGVMCPTQRFWQDKQFEIVKRLVEEVGVGAVYLDQISSAPPRNCFDRSHGHPLGSGSWWVDGYRTLLTRIKHWCTTDGRQVGLTSENNSEPYMDNIDGFLIWTPREENEIPMITAVYSGYALYFASNRSLGFDDVSFRMLQARDMVWGTQLGWEDAEILKPENAAKLEYEGRLARVRSMLNDYFVYGELLEVLQSETITPELTGTWNTWSGNKSVTLKAIHGALWRGPDGSVAAILANADTKPHTFTFKFDADCHHLVRADYWTVSRRTPSGTTALPQQTGRSFTQTIEVPATDALALIFRPAD
jgi:hypothetical protein